MGENKIKNHCNINNYDGSDKKPRTRLITGNSSVQQNFNTTENPVFLCTSCFCRETKCEDIELFLNI